MTRTDQRIAMHGGMHECTHVIPDWFENTHVAHTSCHDAPLAPTEIVSDAH
ncbi:hypothetical protein A33M_3219 [Rhodovulum sp. PH10]|nr:hypothetical protein A33M_3219 [Rhodovulum sp. PH10]